MKIKSLHIENFGPIKEAKLYLADKGLVSIEGVNEDDTSAHSNGSGKSTIVDALYWTLFGKSPREDSKDNIIKDGEKYCLNQIELELDPTTNMKIVRGRGSKKQLKVFLSTKATIDDDVVVRPVTNLEITKGTEALTQDYINRMIGCSEKIFLNSVYSQQEKMPNIPEMTDKEIKTLLEEVAGMEEYETALKYARDTLKEEEEQLKKMSQTVTNMIAEALAIETESNWVRKEVTHYIAVSDELVEEYKVLEEEMLALSDIYDKEHGFNSEYAQSVIKSLKDDFGFDSVLDLTDMTNKLKKDIDKLKAEITERNRQREEISVELTSLHAAISKNQYQRENLLAEKKRIQREKDDHSRECSLCGSVMSDEAHEAFFDAKNHELHDNLERTKELNKEGTALLERHDALKERKSKLDAFLLKAQSKCETMQEDHREHLQALVKYAEAEDAKVNAAANKAKFLKAKTVELSGKIASNGTKQMQNNNLRGVKEKKHAELMAKYSSLLEQINDDNALVKSQERIVEACKAACEVLSQKGVRGIILDTVTPFLNAKTSEYLTALSDGRITAEWVTMRENSKGDMVESFSIEVTKHGGGKTFAALSGGEKRKVRIACALALQDYVATRANKPVDLFIGDEIDDALDTAGLERLMGILQKKAREKGTVLLISHNDLRDWITENTTATMKADKTSYITGSLTCP